MKGDTMNLEGFHSALSVELDRWNELRTNGAQQLQTEESDDMLQATRKSLTNEYNAHVRRVDSLWRQFIDDHKRANGVVTL